MDKVIELMKLCEVPKNYCNCKDCEYYKHPVQEVGKERECTWVYKEQFRKDPDNYCVYLTFPLFTTEKQIELIKLLRKYTLQIYEQGISVYEYEGDYDYDSNYDDFEQDLADITIQLINDKKIDKKEVKEILQDKNRK